MCTTAGSKYASVLPLPVCAMPIMSRPLSAMGQPCAWMGVGSLNPAFSTSLSTYLRERKREAAAGQI